jgi:hypothetical protein
MAHEPVGVKRKKVCGRGWRLLGIVMRVVCRKRLGSLPFAQLRASETGCCEEFSATSPEFELRRVAAAKLMFDTGLRIELRSRLGRIRLFHQNNDGFASVGS